MAKKAAGAPKKGAGKAAKRGATTGGAKSTSTKA